MDQTKGLEPRLTISGLSHSFGSDSVLRDITISVGHGETVAIMGRSGCGKTTLLKCVSLLLSPDSGQCALDRQAYIRDGQPLFAPWEIRRQIGIVFQDLNLFPNLTVLRNVTLGLERASGMARHDAVTAARAALTALDVGELQDRYPDQLSGGQAQRVALARAAVLRPSILLLDEVTSALDPESIETVTKAIRGLRAIEATPGLAIVLVTHYLDFALSFADRIAYMADGSVVEDVPATEFSSSVTHPEAKTFVRRAQAGWIG